MYQPQLNVIAARTKAYGDAMQPPCSPSRIQSLRERVYAEFQVALPMAYVRFLELHNGLDWNGLSIYAADTSPIVGYPDRFILGCIEANRLRRDYPIWKEYIIVGETGDEDYCLEIATSQYAIMDSIAASRIEAFPSFDEMIHEALQGRL